MSVRSYVRVSGPNGVFVDQSRGKNDFITLKNSKDQYEIELTTDTKYTYEVEPISYKDNDRSGIKLKFKRILKRDM